MSLPSMLAGGDLDGDIYCLVKDRRLHFERNHIPGDYTAAQWATIDRPSTVDDVADFVTNYIKVTLERICLSQTDSGALERPTWIDSQPITFDSRHQ